MPDSSRQPCSDQLTTPHLMHFWEKANFAGFLIGGIFYGIVILLFFRCMGALFNPVNHTKEGIRRGLVTYTVAMFSFVTIFTATNLDIQSNSYIDNREFPGVCALPLGPLGYQSLTYSGAIAVCRSLMFLLNSWLADGLLLYRFHVIYSMNHWITAFPCLMYLASIVMGIMLVYQTSQPDSSMWSPGAISFGLPYLSISVSLNILLTIMIVARLTLHIISIRNSMGTPVVASGLYHAIKAVVIMLVESSALYALSSLLFIAPWGASSHLADVFWPILAETQVIASLLIVWRFADRSTLTNSTTVSWNTGPCSVGSQGGSTGGGGSLPDGYPMNSMDPCGKKSGTLVVGVETTVDVHRDGV